MDCLLNYTKEELSSILSEFAVPNFRVAQIYKWLQNGIQFSDMSDIPLQLRESLAKKYIAQPINIEESIESKDKSVKYLYRLSDGNIIEGVFMPHNYGDTLCVSTQVGCRMGCAFCASGIGGLVRNLTVGEILGQIVTVNALHGGTISKRKLTNVVLMGSGEPLDNYDNVTKFLKLVSGADGLNISQRNISLSTCGICENIIRLADEGYSVTLSLSLHATTDESRQKLMPIARKYSLKTLLDSVKHYFNVSGRRVIFEYAMVKGTNMDFFDAKRLAEFCKGMSAHVNLIKLNYVKEKELQGCTDMEAERFCKRLNEMGVSATIRKSYGTDVGGACGQLRRSFLLNDESQGSKYGKTTKE